MARHKGLRAKYADQITLLCIPHPARFAAAAAAAAACLDVEASVAHTLLMRLNQLAAILLAVLNNAAKTKWLRHLFVAATPTKSELTMHHVHAWSRDRRSMPCTLVCHRRRLHSLLMLPQAPQRSRRRRLPSMMCCPLLLLLFTPCVV